MEMTPKKPENLHFFFMRYHQWLTVAAQFFNFIDDHDNHMYVVSQRDIPSELKFLNIFPSDRFISVDIISEILNQYPGAKINIYVQLSSPGLDEFKRYFYPVLSSQGLNSTICFYPDGYTNNVYSEQTIPSFLNECPNVNLGPLFRFDVDFLPIKLPQLLLSSKIIPSSTIEFMNSVDAVRSIAEKEINFVLKGRRDIDVLLILMRPWGSASFLKGSLEFDDGKNVLAKILADLIEYAARDIGRKLCVLIRPDLRDEKLSLDAFFALKKLLNAAGRKSIELTVVSPDWPIWLTFEAFIFHFHDFAPHSRLHVVGLDSTASLPFAAIGRGQTHYFGAPDASLPAYVKNSEAHRRIRHKIRSIKKFVEKLEGNYWTISDMEEGFFKISLSSS